jgi:hypothetical protein
MRITTPKASDADALTDLHLDVWEEAYAALMPSSVFDERRARRAERVQSWRAIIDAGSSDNLLVWSDDGRLLGFSSAGVGHALCEAALGPDPAYVWVLDGNERAIRFYERQGFRFDGTTKPEDVGLERRMVRR